MEVHHHAHTPRKKWTHYIWEFLMLFLAVFCGFLAENFREHQVEHKRTIRYAKQFIEEIKLDTALYNTGILFVTRKRVAIDSMIQAITQEDWKQICYWGIYMDGYFVVKFHEGGFEQIKNSGSLRNFQNEQLTHLIQEYINLRENVEIVQDGLAEYYNKYLTPFIDKNFDRQFLLYADRRDPHLFDSIWLHKPIQSKFLSENKNAGVEFKNMLINLRTSWYLGDYYTLLKKQSIELIKRLQKEYHIKDNGGSQQSTVGNLIHN